MDDVLVNGRFAEFNLSDKFVVSSLYRGFVLMGDIEHGVIYSASSSLLDLDQRGVMIRSSRVTEQMILHWLGCCRN